MSRSIVGPVPVLYKNRPALSRLPWSRISTETCSTSVWYTYHASQE